MYLVAVKLPRSWLLSEPLPSNSFSIVGVGVGGGVRLGIGPPFGTLDQILSYSSFFG
jgi:hypothetical protein